ncbi:uncharacterized protein F5147DRAFT_652914 [Suillus discolor]|uniref:SNF2 N-terminal domain-containing protein n=1 Tax=Suillus discolor TaxID=1912936 RepID=A0A9P7F7L2_9AGAM|nr:uncharacterized protein F5147DRAFT_652914 [Suillus discolor]KAG2108191.1 hypothetical protein F5147DRAFT_652914 [Suillus discolor]
MSKTLWSAVLMSLVAGRSWIFDDESNALKYIYGLGPEMFDVPNSHLTDKQCQSLGAMIDALSHKGSGKECYEILEGKEVGGWAAGRNTLDKWFKKQKVSGLIGEWIDRVWTMLDVSPMQLIHEGLEEGEEFPNILDAKRAKEDVILVILGDHALEKNARGDFHDATATIIHHAWERHRKRFKHAERSLPKKKLDAAVAVKAIEDAEVVTTRMMREVTKHVKALQQAMTWFPKQKDHITEYEKFLKEVIITAVVTERKVPKEKVAVESEDTPSRKRGAARAQKVRIASLAAAGDVEEIWALYLQLFETELGQLEVPHVEDDEDPSGWEDWENSSEDLGVDGWREMDNGTLNHLLQFPGGKPMLFTEFRSKSGLCAWEDMSKKFVKENNDMEQLSLLWHQCVGVAAIVDKIWLSNETEGDIPGILITDEVGVGKTVKVQQFRWVSGPGSRLREEEI